jgi:hypothetical protein
MPQIIKEKKKQMRQVEGLNAKHEWGIFDSTAS